MTHALTRICSATTLAAALSGAALSGTACGPARTTAAEARASAEATWKLEIEGTGAPLVLERMDIYLVEDESQPEVFTLYGADVTLVGEFPRGVHVGYEEKLERLIGQTVELLAEGGNPRAPAKGSITIDGSRRTIRGTFAVHAVSWG